MPKTRASSRKSYPPTEGVAVVIPSTLGAVADRLLTLRDQRSKAQATVDRLQAEETILKNHLIENLPKRETADGIIGKHARAEIHKKPIPQVKDWDKFYKFILKTKDFSFLNKAVGVAAVKDRWEANQVVPGVSKFTLVTVSVTKKS